jgi:hypothetical protein
MGINQTPGRGQKSISTTCSWSAVAVVRGFGFHNHGRYFKDIQNVQTPLDGLDSPSVHIPERFATVSDGPSPRGAEGE